ncbi:acyl-CoA synthetase [Dactylosporangium sp. CA-233914]|uniref:acyl-CoA synthetase n=1 Tax=Dactylosporangium sp. CA-233914 TaxID=3239934 RepID=UPI003D909095
MVNANVSDPVFDWVRHHALRSPHRLALVDPSETTALDYATLDDAVDGWVRRLGSLGASQGDVVAILAQNSIGYLQVMLACGRLGAIFLPLNWRLTPSELAYILSDARPRVLLHDDEHAGTAAGLSVPRAPMDLPDPGGPTPGPVKLRLTDVAAIMYTSGTTGRPKGAQITHGMTFWHAVNISPPARITPDAVHLALLPFFHTGGLNLYVNPVLHAGGAVVLTRKFEADEAFDLLTDDRLGITHVFGVPTVYESLASHPRFASSDLSRLRMAGVGGAACSVPLAETWRAKGVVLAHGWGMTEGGPSGTVADIDDPDTPPGSVGKPLLHIGIRIVRPDGNDVASDEVGELWIKGPSVTPGYWRNPQATAAAFSDGWFRTGDAARRDGNGYYFIVGRWKDMYISGGENVYPAEVEARIVELDAVATVAVVGVPDGRWGEAGIAFVVPRPGAALTPEDVLAHCAQHLAKFKIPRQVVLVADLPTTGSGKIQKRILAERFADPKGP